ncbi:HAD-IA family hydrolase [Vibrio caribbeanicus]|uniref:HAD family hydrolase n=1 Tax=Vibrio caribbeanicus TaxID=701175 RepID=UPI0030DC1DE1
MHQMSNYDVFIFDCDGVIIDSNQLKIEAMNRSLTKAFGSSHQTDICLDYFKKNFGRSRFHHINYFVEEIFLLSGNERDNAYESLLLNYSKQCKSLYLKASLTPGVIDFLTSLNGNLYIASGSEERELRQVFKERDLDQYFTGIYGSPTSKSKVVSNILEREAGKKAIMFGDALSDMNAAKDNLIDFIAYMPFSNVKNELKKESLKYGFSIANSWSIR